MCCDYNIDVLTLIFLKCNAYDINRYVTKTHPAIVFKYMQINVIKNGFGHIQTGQDRIIYHGSLYNIKRRCVLHDSYYGILLHAVQIRRKMFFGFLWGILKISF